MGTSYKEDSEKYKVKKKMPIIDEDAEKYPKRKKKKKNKRANHKHNYIPAVYNMSYRTNLGNVKCHQTFGFHCDKCGRVENMYFMWSHHSERFERFKKEYPDYVEITLPEGWDYFRDKVIPI